MGVPSRFVIIIITTKNANDQFVPGSPHFVKPSERDPVEESMGTLPAPFFVPSSPASEVWLPHNHLDGLSRRNTMT